MSLPVFPSTAISRENAVNLLLGSVALEELGLSHVLNSEGEKIQYVLGALPEHAPPVPATLDDVLKLDRAVEKTLESVLSNQLLLGSKLDCLVSYLHACVSSVFAFPSADSQVVASFGFVNAVAVGYFWSAARGDSVSQTFSAGAFANRAKLELDVVDNVLNSGAFVDWELVLNGTAVGHFTVPEGFTGPVTAGFAFPDIPGPAYQVSLRVVNEVPFGNGSISLAYASDLAHSLTLTACNEGQAVSARVVRTPRGAAAPVPQPAFSLEKNNREP